MDNIREEYEKWAKERMSKQKAFNDIKSAVAYARKQPDVPIYEVWKSPDGKQYLAVNSDAFEAAYRLGYKMVVDDVKYYDTDKIEEVQREEINMADKRKIAPEEGPHGVDRWTSNGYGLMINGIPVEPTEEEEESDAIEEVKE